MFQAMKASHYVVAITIFGSLLVKLLTIASTGLFLLQGIKMQNIPTRFATQQKFNGSTYESSRVGGSAALTVSGVTLTNLTFPAGTTDQYAFQPFNILETVSSKCILFSNPNACL